MSVESLNTIELPDLVKRARGEMTMRDVAQRAGVSPALISRIESGEVRRPSTETLTKIAEAVDRDVELLVIAVDPALQPDALNIVRRALLQLPPGGAWHLAGAWHSLNDHEEQTLQLETQAAELITRFRSERDSIRESSRSREPADRSGIGDDLDRAKRLEGLEQEMASREAAWTEARDRLNDLVRKYAGYLFTGPYPRFGAVLRPAEHSDLSALVDAAHSAGGWSRLADSGAISGLIARLAARTNAEHERSRRLVQQLNDGQDLEQRWATWRAARADGNPLAEEDGQRVPGPEDGAASELGGSQAMAWPSDSGFRQLMRDWQQLTPERQRRTLEFAADQRRLSIEDEIEVSRAKGASRQTQT